MNIHKPRLLPRRLMFAVFLAMALVGVATADVRSKSERPQSLRLDKRPMPLEQAFALKQAMGEPAFAAETQAVVGKLIDRTEKTAHCASRAETAAAAQLELVRRSADPLAAARSRAAAEAALAQRRALRTLYLGGGDAPPPYGQVRRMAAHARSEANPRLASLYRRMAEDQFSHIDSITLRPFLGPGVHTAWEQGLDDAALAYVDATITSEWCPLKVANAAWLKADLRDHGWYTISTYGADADRAAWLIVQHARHDLALQERVLAMLEPLWSAGETRGENFALLYDQTAQYRGRPGRFGVVGECTAPGVWTPAPQENPDAVDAWRTKAGMPPLAEYIATRSRGCTD